MSSGWQLVPPANTCNICGVPKRHDTGEPFSGSTSRWYNVPDMEKPFQKKNSNRSKKILNKGVNYRYDISDKMTAGIVLRGYEVKGVRENRANLSDGFVRIENGEVWLFGVTIGLPSNARIPGYEPRAKRKLLLKKQEIDRLQGAVASKGMVVVPLELRWERNMLKVVLGIGKGVKKHDKRAKIAEREQRREIQMHTKTQRQI